MRRPTPISWGAIALVTLLAAQGCGLRHEALDAGVPVAAGSETGLPPADGGQLLTGAGSDSHDPARADAPARGPASAVGRPAGTGAAPVGTSVHSARERSTVGQPNRAAGPIQIGFQVAVNTQAAFAATGASSGPADEEHMVKALVAWVNATGGINGRQLVAVIHPTDPTQGTFASQAAAACADFTQDHHVLAIASSRVSSTDDLPGRTSTSRWPRATVDGLDAAGYFAGGARVGLLNFDAPVYARVVARLRTEMQRKGHAFASDVTVATPPSVADFGAMSAAIGNAILKFRQAGVDHVMFAASAELPFFFMAQAESQQSRPRYGLSSNDGPDTQINIGAPDAQLRGALAVG